MGLSVSGLAQTCILESFTSSEDVGETYALYLYLLSLGRGAACDSAPYLRAGL